MTTTFGSPAADPAVTTPGSEPPGWLTWLGFVALCNGVGLASSLVGDQGAFYATLERPAWAPPAWLFAPVWTALYTLLGTAAYLVWRRGGGRRRRRALAIFGVQLALNAAWTPVFFGLHALGAALAVLGAYWVAVLAMLVAFTRVSRLAGALVAPLLAWTTFAGALNAAVWHLN